MIRQGLVALLLLSLLGCGDSTATLLYINVLARAGVSNPAALAVTLSQGGQAEAPRLLRGPGNGAVALPSSFVIQADGRNGWAKVNLQALSKPALTAENIIAQGQGSAILQSDQRVDMTIVLQPSDSQVKEKIAPDPVFGVHPRVAGDGQGNYVVVWEDSSISSGQSLYDVWFQLFGPKGENRYKGAFLLTKEHQPAVAMQQAGTARGHFVVAWVRGSGGKGTIFSRGMDAKGQPDSLPGAGKPWALSLSAWAARPQLAARLPSGYMAVWQEEDDSGGLYRVMGRILDDHGRGMVSPTGQQAPFMLSSFARTSAEPMPAVAADANGGVMVTWNVGGTIKASVYAKVGGTLKLMRGDFQVAKSNSGLASSPDIAALPYGYAIIWSDKSTFAPDTSGRCIKLRRFNSSGAALSAEYILNTTTNQDQLQPSLAARTRDGSLLATWTSKDSGAGDVRARALLHNGLPVGTDFLLNTTTTGQQQAAALAPQSPDGFAAVFTDGTGSTPALRARLFFPDYIGESGQIGALCEGQNQCSSPSLFCVATQAGKRCLGPCKGGATAACLSGGVCFTNTKLSASYCTYPSD